MDILTQEQYKQYQKISRYQSYPIYYNTLDSKYMCGTCGHLDDDTIFTWHTVQDGDTPDSLSLYYYGNPIYYWIILDFNRIQNAYDDLPIGTKIKIPAFSNINFDN